MSKWHFGRVRGYMGWTIRDVYEDGPCGMKRSCWQAKKNDVLLFADTLAEVKERIREEEYQYEE